MRTPGSDQCDRSLKIEAEQKENGVEVPTPENLKPGYFVKYRGQWFPVTRVNKKTVTIGNWLGIASMTFKLKYSELSTFKS